MTNGRLRTLLVAVALVLPGCAGSATEGKVATPRPAGAGDATRDPDAGTSDTAGGSGQAADIDDGSAGAQLLSFSAPAIGGGSVTGADFRGRPTLLWFWAPW